MGNKRKLDEFSYALGVIDAFNEVVRGGVKKLALAHPVREKMQRDKLAEAAEEICKSYGTKLYLEEEPLLTDLFPLSLNNGTYNILFYQKEEVLEAYLGLKKSKAELEASGRYRGAERRAIAEKFGRLLSYSEEAIERLIAENAEKEKEAGC